MKKSNKKYYINIHKDFEIFHRVNLLPNYPDFHIHDHFEISFILSDNIYADVNQVTNSLKNGTLLLFNNIDLHRIHYPVGTDYERYVLSFYPQFIAGFTEAARELLDCFYYRPFDDAQILPLASAEKAELVDLFDRLTKAYEDNNEKENLLCKILTCEILYYVNRIYKAQHKIESFPENSDYYSICDMMDYIHENMDQKLDIESLSQRFYLSKRKLNLLFHQITGMSPGKYILTCRIMKAKALLAKGISVEETCIKSGFGNTSNFIRVFKQYTGVTPKQYGLANNSSNK